MDIAVYHFILFSFFGIIYFICDIHKWVENFNISHPLIAEETVLRKKEGNITNYLNVTLQIHNENERGH